MHSRTWSLMLRNKGAVSLFRYRVPDNYTSVITGTDQEWFVKWGKFQIFNSLLTLDCKGAWQRISQNIMNKNGSTGIRAGNILFPITKCNAGNDFFVTLFWWWEQPFQIHTLKLCVTSRSFKSQTRTTPESPPEHSCLDEDPMNIDCTCSFRNIFPILSPFVILITIFPSSLQLINTLSNHPITFHGHENTYYCDSTWHHWWLWYVVWTNDRVLEFRPLKNSKLNHVLPPQPICRLLYCC